MVTIREMLPDRRNAPPRWEVSVGDDVVGWVERRALRGAKLPFYAASGKHPRTGDVVSLELSADFDERVGAIVAFWADPMSSAQHLPRHLRDMQPGDSERL